MDNEQTEQPKQRKCSCGEIIPEERLEILPDARQCTSCAQHNPSFGKRIEILESSAGGRNGWTKSD